MSYLLICYRLSANINYKCSCHPQYDYSESELEFSSVENIEEARKIAINYALKDDHEREIHLVRSLTTEELSAYSNAAGYTQMDFPEGQGYIEGNVLRIPLHEDPLLIGRIRVAKEAQKQKKARLQREAQVAQKAADQKQREDLERQQLVTLKAKYEAGAT